MLTHIDVKSCFYKLLHSLLDVQIIAEKFRNVTMGLLAQRVECPEGDDTVAVLVVKLHLPGGAVVLAGPGLLKVPAGELIEGYKAVRRGDIDLGEERADAVGEVEAVVVVDKVLLLLEEFLPLLHVVVRLAAFVIAVEEAIVLALPLLVVQPALQLGNGRVEGGRVLLLLMLPPTPTGDNARRGGGGGGWEVLGVELEAAVEAAAVGMGLETGGVGGEEKQQHEGARYVKEEHGGRRLPPRRGRCRRRRHRRRESGRSDEECKASFRVGDLDPFNMYSPLTGATCYRLYLAEQFFATRLAVTW